MRSNESILIMQALKQLQIEIAELRKEIVGVKTSLQQVVETWASVESMLDPSDSESLSGPDSPSSAPW